MANIRDNKLQRTVRSIAGDLLDMSQLGSFDRMLGMTTGMYNGIFIQSNEWKAWLKF